MDNTTPRLDSLDVGIGVRLIQGPAGHMAVMTAVHVSDMVTVTQVTLFKYFQGRWVYQDDIEVPPGDAPIFNRALEAARQAWSASGYMD